MQLIRYRVFQFRSVEDSGWIEVDQVTALIGTNESGKTNLLLPLWKLNPAKDGEIDPNSDYPRKHFSTIRSSKVKPTFVQAEFALDAALTEHLKSVTGLPASELQIVRVSRSYDGKLAVEFPLVNLVPNIESSTLIALLSNARADIDMTPPMPSETEQKSLILKSLDDAVEAAQNTTEYDREQLERFIQSINYALLDRLPKKSSILPRMERLRTEIQSLVETITISRPEDSDEVVQLILDKLPYFVYYSNYGNLDSEIYLPHVVQNLSREDLGQKELAKARTLKVLFEFVNLQPVEILELGKDVQRDGTKPTPEQIESTSERKKERELLLMSASTLLTDKFREWWRQGDYRFRFQADGDHFRIWVSDDKRTEEVELEGRSTGLQWFLSFYLVFLVESVGDHSNCILLLDEPGLSLHPLAQRDLSDFFEALSKDNQILYTTHSPFLVDSDRLDRVRKVYVAPDGSSKVSANLGAEEGDTSTRGAGYAVHAAVGLTVAESLLIGCQPVIVEGPSDQHYLTTIKTLLIANGKINPSKELVFPTAGGTSGVKAISGILSGRDGDLPVVLLDSDGPGVKYYKSLQDGLYSDCPDRVLQIGNYTGIEGSEIEDLIPTQIIAKAVDRMHKGSTEDFADVFNSSEPVVPQIEVWAKRNGVTLEKGWKVILAKRVKEILLTKGVSGVDDDTLERWTRLFNAFIQNGLAGE